MLFRRVAFQFLPAQLVPLLTKEQQYTCKLISTKLLSKCEASKLLKMKMMMLITMMIWIKFVALAANRFDREPNTHQIEQETKSKEQIVTNQIISLNAKSSGHTSILEHLVHIV